MITIRHIPDNMGPRYSFEANEGDWYETSSFELWKSPVEDGHMKISTFLRESIEAEFPSARFGTGFGFPSINMSDADMVKLKLLVE